MKKPKLNRETIRTKNFTATRVSTQGGFVYDVPWEIRYRKSKEDPDRDSDTVLGAVQCAAPDQYECSEAEFRFNVLLTEADYIEILSVLPEAAAGEASFITVRADTVTDEALRNALENLNYTADPVKKGNLLHEVTPPSYIAIYLCLGVSVGIAIGAAIRSTTIGLALGMGGGLLLGTVLDSSEKKRRAGLKKARFPRKVTDDGDDY